MNDCLFVISRAPSTVSQSTICVHEPVTNDDPPSGDAASSPGQPGPIGLDVSRCRRFEDDLAAALAVKGRRVLLIPHLYHLSSSHPAVARIAGDRGDVLLSSWLHPRPAYWALRAHGLEGEMGDTSAEAGGACSCNRARTIRCWALGSFDSTAVCAEELMRFAASPGEPGAAEEVADEAPPRWYPVLDYSRCANCKQCLEFCMFDVYSLVDGNVVATQPDNCKPGCPACARVCPAGAIMFPHYTSDPAIAGAPGATISGAPVDVEAFFQDADRAASQEPCSVCGSACDSERSLDGTAPPGKTVCPACGCIRDASPDHAHPGPQETRPDSLAPESPSPVPCRCKDVGRDDLDDLIDALDALDT